MFKWIKKYLQKSVDSVLVLDPAWEVKPKKKKKAKKKKKKKKKSEHTLMPSLNRWKSIPLPNVSLPGRGM